MSEIKYIDRIQVSNFWGLYDVDWKLDPSVNILIGKNGSGKSTLLNIIKYSYDAAKNASGHLHNVKSFNEINELFENGICKDATIYYNDKSSFNCNVTYVNDKPIFGSSTKNINIFQLPVNIIRTFDINFVERNPFDKIDKPHIKTEFDILLNDLVNEYVEYQLILTKRIINHNQDKNEVFRRFEFFQNVLDQLFADSNKKINRDANRIDFLLNNSIPINVTQLSTGEKQLLIILITVLIQDGKSTVLLIDEPEVSLHIDWQLKFVGVVKKLNPNCQLIIATHSPSIFGEDGEYPIYPMEDVLGIKESVNG